MNANKSEESLQSCLSFCTSSSGLTDIDYNKIRTQDGAAEGEDEAISLLLIRNELLENALFNHQVHYKRNGKELINC